MAAIRPWAYRTAQEAPECAGTPFVLVLCMQPLQAQEMLVQDRALMSATVQHMMRHMHTSMRGSIPLSASTGCSCCRR